MKVIADTNILVRLIVDDDPDQRRAAVATLERASVVIVPNTAFCELVWVLSSAYRRTAPEIAIAMRRILSTGRVVANREAVEAGLAFLEAGGGFSDGMIAHEGRQLGGDVFLTFDRRALAVSERLGIAALAPDAERADGVTMTGAGSPQPGTK